ncbi:UDP-N-acetylmuramate dehydrogenase [Coxiella-like endosymbiont of Amblyomma americanum]|uniref:UDP-N-acetylmuramate dehydrogenase n=1 Tax=Coxiella-like endosymbiont of Amblyomma americanum TaxID=1987500 RepID=UPI000F89DC7C|nr:UDP-N-acetylmuramate dehydrogenase [Coxiella-like endosymbiont of Amblyomma americanum]AUJ58737.1 UDP-N-acetylenolpyruvoylglucosamine reductase [Coxiella-like endosymbiont of Amblyomma americanum]
MKKKINRSFVGLIHNHNLARYTSWRVGGNAERFYRPANLADLQNFLVQLPYNEPLTWLGLGSNVLIRDGGVKGTVILTLNRLKKISFFKKSNRLILRVESGITCHKLAKLCANLGLEDGAFFAGIPGTIGGALTMNAGAFGKETWFYVTRVETIDRMGVLRNRQSDEFKISYREIFGLDNQFFVAGYFSFDQRDIINAKRAVNILLKKRTNTQPIGTFNCGSVFRNPPKNYAAQLIESSGLKGVRFGNAEVSKKHANFIVNTGKANASDIEKLIQYIAQQVYKIHGIQLIKEIHILGNYNNSL